MKPELLWKNFKSLCDIPRPSKHEGRALDFIAQYGRDLGLDVLRDPIGNVIIRKPATPGMENCPGVILQGHADMVPQKRPESSHDFLKDPIEMVVDGDWIKANNTTLGADNGIGVSAAMSILADKDVEHGPLEILVTTDEETGMTGAINLQPGLLHGSVLLNLDSEKEGDIYIGCAGGQDITATFTVEYVETASEDIAYKVMISGLRGGHSGMDINIGVANANKLLVRFLKFAAANFEAMLADIQGGTLRNAIPRDAYAILTIDSEDADEFVEMVAEFNDMLREEYDGVEPDMLLSCEIVKSPEKVFSEMSTDDVINALQGCPDGVVRMSPSIKGLVQTSSNLASVSTKDDKVVVNFLIRSASESEKENLSSTIESVMRLAGATVEIDNGYPGWLPNPQSPILRIVADTYRNLYNQEPSIMAIHAGLECGIMAGIYPKWDMVSFGPTIEHPHSPDERVNVPSVERFYELLKEVLKRVK
ncbi:MAG: aminoacyl-histidine dipeptidase [Marinilabiliaceae bacterium]|nr:aminoacyl-histidine dipeptidase [Marinilabiliaceae bacterium]